MACAHLALAKGNFVDIAHVCSPQANQITLDQQRHQFARSTGIDCINPGMNFDPSGNTQHQLAGPRAIADIARGTVTASKQQQIHTQRLNVLSQPFGIFSGGFFATEFADCLMLEAHIPQ